MQKLDGYKNLDKIFESNDTVIYRAFEEKNKRAVILKLSNTPYASPEKISRLKHEYDLMRKLSHSGAIQVYDMVTINNSPMIIMEDIGGHSLSFILKSEDFNSKKFLALSIRIAEIIGNIHQCNIIHKDINPSNIVWNIKKDIVKIIDFEIATELPREITSLKNPQGLEGTLAYISPEQTGRMNRSVDYRTDFYSLGVTLYRLITGRLPFESDDQLKLIHSHIAIMPIPPHEIDRKIPVTVSNIIMKLMSKNAEERYLSAYGLKADLERCELELWEDGTISAFELGQQDISDKFQIPQKLYGREQETDVLMSTFERARENGTELTLVSGSAGIGKSMLVNEIHKPVVKYKGCFISGKFEKLKRDQPYKAIKQAFTGFAQQILSENETENRLWKEKLLSALGPNGKIITDIFPLFELIIGKQPDVPEMGPVESQNRFDLVLLDFMRVLTDRDRPLVIFLDDLQWADIASLHLLKLFMTDSNIKHLYIIGAFRHSDTPKSHPLILTLEEIKKSDAIVNNIFLKPLNEVHVNHLLGDALNRPAEETRPLSELLIRKTGGNPFFINEFLKSLNKEHLIEFSFDSGWFWDISGIREMQATDDVVDLIAEKISYLPKDSQEVLKLAACIGVNFDIPILMQVSEKTGEEILSALNVVIREGMLNKSDNMYKFSHDHVLEAAYSLIPDEVKSAWHYRIGNQELKNTSEEELGEKIFYVVDQLNDGVDLITSGSEKNSLAKLNLMAGKKALVSNSYASALIYLNAGIELLEKYCWQKDYAFTQEIYQEATIAAQLSGGYETMNRFAEEVIQNGRTILDKVKAYEAKIFACISRNQLLEGIKIGLDVLGQLGVRMSEKPGKLRILYELLLVKRSLLGKSVENLINLPRMKDPFKRATMRILSGLGTPAYYVAPDLLPLVVFNMVKYSVRYGNSIYSPYSYAGFGLIHCGVLGAINTGYQYGKLAVDIVNEHNIKEIKSRVGVLTGYFINHWKKPLRDSIEPLLEAYKMGLETGDLEFAANAANNYSAILFYSGTELVKVEEEMLKYANTIRKLNQDIMLNYQLMQHQFVLNLKGNSDDPVKLIGSSYDQDTMLPIHIEANDLNALFCIYYFLLNLNYLFEDYNEAVKYAELVKPYIETQISQVEIPIIYFYDSLSRLALCREEKRSIQKKYLKKAIKNQLKMKKWAFHAPANYSHKYNLVEAEIARIKGQKFKAIEHYNLAIKLARENRFLQEEALSLELTAKFMLEMNKIDSAVSYMTKAYNIYGLWGATAKVEQIKEKYG